MIAPKLDERGFQAPIQREILSGLSDNQEISQRFFLTGGTALSAFYLGHRVSEDLDLFSYEQRDLGDIAAWIAETWPHEAKPLRMSDGFFMVVIREVKVDIVFDHLAIPGVRARADLGGGRTIAVDTIENIASNKLTTLASRTEPKDYIDFYFLRRRYPELDLAEIYANAAAKDAQFDDPATAAFQIEIGTEEIRRLIRDSSARLKSQRVPPLLQEVDWNDFWRFYNGLAEWIYGKG